MNVYLLTQDLKPDTYHSMVIVANTVAEAKLFTINQHRENNRWVDDPDMINANLIGKATNTFTKCTEICTSYNTER